MTAEYGPGCPGNGDVKMLATLLPGYAAARLELTSVSWPRLVRVRYTAPSEEFTTAPCTSEQPWAAQRNALRVL